VHSRYRESLGLWSRSSSELERRPVSLPCETFEQHVVVLIKNGLFVLESHSSINHYCLPVNLDCGLRNGSRECEATVVLATDTFVRSHANCRGTQRELVSCVSDQVYFGV